MYLGWPREENQQARLQFKWSSTKYTKTYRATMSRDWSNSYRLTRRSNSSAAVAALLAFFRRHSKSCCRGRFHVRWWAVHKLLQYLAHSWKISGLPKLWALDYNGRWFLLLFLPFFFFSDDSTSRGISSAIVHLSMKLCLIGQKELNIQGYKNVSEGDQNNLQN